jgi:hypothetical protein
MLLGGLRAARQASEQAARWWRHAEGAEAASGDAPSEEEGGGGAFRFRGAIAVLRPATAVYRLFDPQN